MVQFIENAGNFGLLAANRRLVVMTGRLFIYRLRNAALFFDV